MMDEYILHCRETSIDPRDAGSNDREVCFHDNESRLINVADHLNTFVRRIEELRYGKVRPPRAEADVLIIPLVELVREIDPRYDGERNIYYVRRREELPPLLDFDEISDEFWETEIE